MRKTVMLVAAAAVILVAGPALADHSHENEEHGVGHQGGQGGDGGNGGNGGGGGSVHHNSSNSAIAVSGAGAQAGSGASVSINDSTRQYAPAPSGFGPGLAAANCMGSWSVGMSGANGIAGGGLGFGATKESKECNRRAYADQLFKLAQEYRNPTFAAAGLALMANNKEVRAALIEVGILNADDKEAKSGLVDPYASVRPDWLPKN